MDAPTTGLEERIDRLIASVESLETELAAHRGELRSYKSTLDRKVIRATIAIAVAITGVIFALGASVVAVVASLDARSAIDSVNDVVLSSEADRAVARVASCVQDNVKTEHNRKALKLSLAALAPTPLTPEVQAVFKKYNDEVDNQLSFRDCSTGGIAVYLSVAPKDPAVPG